MIPNAELTLTSLQRGTAMKATTGQEGLFTFPNLEPGTYELKVAAAGFRPALVRPIAVTINQIVRNDVRLDVGTDVQTVEVQATAPQLNFENASRSEGVTPETLNELPLIVSGGPRNSAQFTVLLPGVTTGGGNNAFDARINGGLQSGDEAIMDGASMQEGHMSQSGMVAFADFRMTPDMISEFRVLTSTYEPEYGSSTGGQIIAVTKSGTNSLHGGGFEYLRNKALNATQFTNDRGPGDQRPKDNEHEFGGFLGGPVIIPKIYKGKGWARSYFFTDVEFFRIRGGASRPTLSIASTQERQGDFTDWPYPIYDPKSTRLNPNFNASAGESASNPKYIRDQISCNGRLNVICPDRISPLSLGWLKYLPTPTSAGPLNNYLVPQPVPDSILADANHFLIKIDQYLGNSDHVAATIWRQKTPAKFFSVLPIQLASETFSDPQNSWVSRMNYDHTFTPTLLNHAAFGYLNRNEGYGAVDYQHAGDVPKIAGVPSIDYPPELRFGNGFEGFGNTAGIPTGNVTTRPTYVVNDMATWIKGRHTLKFGGEYRSIEGNIHTNSNLSGHFQFEAAQTGLPTVEGSGNAMASFLLGAVHDANVNLYSIASRYPRQKAYIWHVGDTWKATNKLSINYGIRWDKFTPSREKRNAMSFFDFGPNPGAGGRPGRLAFATEDHPYPEADWNAGWGPRLGVAYAWNDKTVIRTGYGILPPGPGGAVRANSVTVGGLVPRLTTPTADDRKLLPAGLGTASVNQTLLSGPSVIP